jgi:methyl-accepting chemotaxis protein
VSDIGTAAKSVLGSADQLTSQSKILRSEVDRFLATVKAA